MEEETQLDFSEDIKNFSIRDYLVHMQGRHKIFYSLVSIPNIVFTKNTPTLDVKYDKHNHEVVMRINPEFFFPKTFNERVFLLSHEAMHIVLNHLDQNSGKLWNIAYDIVINEWLVHNYFYGEKNIQSLFDIGIACVENIFSEEQIIEHNIIKDGTAEYYYNLLQQLNPEAEGGCGCSDCENKESDSQYGEIPDIIQEQMIESAIEQIGEKDLNEFDANLEEMKEKIDNNEEPGKNTLGEMISVLRERRNKKVNWKTILRKHYATLSKSEEVEKYSFEKISRRNALLDHKKMMIPNIYNSEKKVFKKHDVYFFLDVSGSCLDFSQEFFNFAKTLPTDYCNIHFFSFDTEVYSIKIEDSKLRGGGGTSFEIIENYCILQDQYPNLVFVITDGFGDEVLPKKPKNWVWFLTNHNTKQYINSLSHSYVVSDIYV